MTSNKRLQTANTWQWLHPTRWSWGGLFWGFVGEGSRFSTSSPGLSVFGFSRGLAGRARRYNPLPWPPHRRSEFWNAYSIQIQQIEKSKNCKKAKSVPLPRTKVVVTAGPSTNATGPFGKTWFTTNHDLSIREADGSRKRTVWTAKKRQRWSAQSARFPINW